jgi:hypothetical protein
MADDTSKIAEKLKAASVSWWSDFLSEDVRVFGLTHELHHGELAMRVARRLTSIGLTVSDDAGVLAKAKELARDATLGKVKFLEPCKYHDPVPDGGPPVDCGNCDGWGHAPVFAKGNPESGEAETEPNPCPLSFPHMPHDYCDGKPNAEQFGNLKPTADTRGDKGFEAWWESADIWQQDRDARTKKYCLASWQAARAELLAKVAGVRAGIEKRLSEASDDRAFHKRAGNNTGPEDGKIRAFMACIADLDAIFPSNPAAGRAD